VLPSFPISDLVTGGFNSVSEYKAAQVLLTEVLPSFSISALVTGGFNSVSEYKAAQVPVQNLIGQGGILVENVYPAYTLAEIVSSNFTTKPSMIVSLLELANARTTDTVSISDLFSVGLQSAQDYAVANIPVKKLLDSSSFSADAVFPQYPLNLILNSGFNKTAIIQQLNQKVSIAEFKAENVSLAEFKAASVPVPQLITAFSLQEVVQVFPLSTIVTSGFKTPTEIIRDLQALSSPPSIATMISAGLNNSQDFTDAGITISPTFSTQVAQSAVLKNINTAWTPTNTAPMRQEIYSMNTAYSTLTSTEQREKTDIVLSQVYLKYLHETFYTQKQPQKIPDIIKPSAIKAANPTLRATDFKAAQFTPLQIYPLYTNKELLASGYTTVPSFPAASIGNKMKSFNSQV
jgi:hypothetical protein